MKKVTVIIPTVDDLGSISGPFKVKTIADIGLQGPKGDVGDPGPQGPGIESNITRITASASAPLSPDVNDLWIDIS